MVNSLSLFLLQVLLLTSCTYAQMGEINYVASEKVKVANQIEVGNSASSLKSAFGKPDSITEQFEDQVFFMGK